MIELLQSTDPVRLSFLRQALESAGVAAFVSDPGPWPGALPMRLMVAEDDVELARRAIDEAEAAVGGGC